ncbi:DUF6069 family protein [Sphaerisporangium corydalis]|uniref:DUF6069 family protein n=1 Tax=Sphaerisporangium corydalis TaxID=1441875 RepID=A0ABV9EHI8_9ACTN|nr:DUF6069 family protein [Sphaerisporangium corydalis]
MTTDARTPQPIAGGSPVLRVRALATAGTVVATGLIWLVAQVLDVGLVVDPRNGQPAGPIGLPIVVMFTLVLSLLGWGALAVLERLTRRARTIWTVLALVVLAVSFVPVTFVGATAGTRIVLSLMHVAVAAVLIPSLRRKRG